MAGIPHYKLFGWTGKETSVQCLRQWDIDFNTESLPLGIQGASIQPGDWWLEINSCPQDLHCEYDCESADYTDGFKDLGRTLARTGAVVVAVSAGYSDSVVFVLRGGNWTGIHVYEHMCDGSGHCGKRVIVESYKGHEDDCLFGIECAECSAEAEGVMR